MTSCPKCGYRRRSDPDVPDDQCPKCGVIYDLYTGPRAVPGADEAPRKPRSAARMVIALGISALSFVYFGYQLYRDRPVRAGEGSIRELRPAEAEALAKLSPAKVVLFAGPATACRECADARALFERMEVEYAELDVSRDTTARSFMREQLKRIDVPIVVIGTRMYPGYSEEDLVEALEPQ